MSDLDFKKAYDSVRKKVLYNILSGYSHETGKTNENMSALNVKQSPGRQEFV